MIMRAEDDNFVRVARPRNGEDQVLPFQAVVEIRIFFDLGGEVAQIFHCLAQVREGG